MCVVSMVGDHYHDKWGPMRPWDWDKPINPHPLFPPTISDPSWPPPAPVTREEFEQLRRDVLEMKKLLEKAAEYDRATGQPGCENEEKIALLKKVADLFGISIDIALSTK